MSGDRYHITDQHGIYFLTFTVVEWTDVFTRPVYKCIITDSLNYCNQQKGLEIFAWVLMTNHLHLVVRAHAPFRLSDVIRDFKKFTSKKIVDIIQASPESRKDWLLHRFWYAANTTGRARDFKVWTDDNHAVYLEDKVPMWQKIHYIHQNPVRQQIVELPEEYLFSSAPCYAGKKNGLVKVTVPELI